MKYFTKSYIQFFKELEKNNNKEWFHANKKRYESDVKLPFENFVGDLIDEIEKHEDLDIQPKDCILRINRDIRFAKDKTPYNLHRTAFISKGGRKDKSLPGLFIRLSPDMIGVMGGCFGPDKDQLKAIRAAIISKPKEINKLLQTKSFKDTFGKMQGTLMKRIPKEYQAAAEKEPLILLKQYYYMAEDRPSLIYSEDLLKTFIGYYKAMKPMNDYLLKAIKK